MHSDTVSEVSSDSRPELDGGPLALVLDVGGSWMRVALASRDGHLLWQDRVRTHAQEGAGAVTALVEAQIDRGRSEAGDKKIAGIGLALAGPVDPQSGIMFSPPNIPSLDGVSFKQLLKGKVDCPVFVANDATLAALGEYRYGAGIGAHTLVYLTISTGIGGGVVVEGRPMMGANGMAGELGHMSIVFGAPLCKCGNRGCLEKMASGTAIADKARELLANGGPSMIIDLASGDLARVSAATVFDAAEKGDGLAREILEVVGQALGAGLVNVLHTFNPDVIVLGGGVSLNHWEYLRSDVEEYIRTHAMDHILKMGYRLALSSLGDDIGLLGAAALVWREVESDR